MTRTKAARSGKAETGTSPGAKAGRIRIGVGGWTFEPWRGPFYPDKLPQKQELGYASRHLTSIEINGTYYGSQKPESFARWHDETPDDFVFSLKAPRFATNRKVLAEAGPTIERFLTGGVLMLKDKLGPINWQFMATKAFDPADFEAFLKLLPASAEGRSLRHVVEVRHESFKCDDFIALTRTHGVAIVIAGDSKFPQIADPTAAFVYARIMGTAEDEPQGYPAEALDRWAARAKAWAAGQAPEGLDYVGKPHTDKARDVYLYVISGHKVRNPAAAMALIERVG
ncbi:DUF72 domain-containing protein [Rhodopila sp.]|jgi:uncharacterized protein YecE (DUF72 family)|uniref:DUF72 domain-containing protein n=1 Tax=Rhodopila sp. TaxID=2480087 RepID=UPI002C670800|nr:DUF72 domain-containing protein [Rhodopila sp.]HVZ09584.1 DUF72 domain-containing protein [Rhodopila sp.]